MVVTLDIDADLIHNLNLEKATSLLQDFFEMPVHIVNLQSGVRKECAMLETSYTV